MPAGISRHSCWKGTDGCTDYSVGDVPCTGPRRRYGDILVEELVSSVVEFIETHTGPRIRSHHVGQNIK